MAFGMSVGAVLLMTQTLGAPASDASVEVATEQAPAVFQMENVTALPTLSRTKHRWLKPKHHLLGTKPRGQTDFTAYTLEFGEVKIGIASVTMGILPRTQLGTVPALNALGIYNANLKINALRVGPLDVALTGAHYRLPLGDFLGTYSSVGSMISLQANRHWSLHAGGSYTHIQAKGNPDLSGLSPLLTTLTKGELEGVKLDDEFFGGVTPRITGEIVTLRVATDVRFNRRDSLVLQGQAIVWAHTENELPFVPPVLNLDKALSHDGRVPVGDVYVASLAYQASWKQLDLRIGVGMSSVKYAWLLQSTELSYRFGGKSRRTQARQKKMWRKNRGDVGKSPV